MKIPFKRKPTHSNKEEDITSKTSSQTCFACKNLISGEIKRPEWKWNLNTSLPMCNECYEKKSKAYEKVNNYCNECNKKLGFIRYNPKPSWGMNGQLCRRCWDLQNSTFKK